MSIAIAPGAVGAPVEIAPSSQPDLVAISEPVTAATSDSEPKPAEGSGTDAAPVKRAYPAPAAMPTQSGPARYPVRLQRWRPCMCPARQRSKCKVRLRDLDTGNILFETEFRGGSVNSYQALLRPLRRRDMCAATEVLLTHEYFGTGPRGADPVPGRHTGRHPWAGFPMPRNSREKHGCRLTCAMVRR